MANRKYSDEFREEAVKQITERGYSVKEVSARLGVSTKSLYKWLGGTLEACKLYGSDAQQA